MEEELDLETSGDGSQRQQDERASTSGVHDNKATDGAPVGVRQPVAERIASR